jgi:hypothetical protein
MSHDGKRDLIEPGGGGLVGGVSGAPVAHDPEKRKGKAKDKGEQENAH